MSRNPANGHTGWTIRHAQDCDRSAIETHLSETWLATYAPLVGRTAVEAMLTDLRRAADLTTYLCSDGANLLVAAPDRGEVHGSIAIGMSRHMSYITAMYVRPAWQRRGLGRALIEAALDSAPPDRPVALSVLAMRREIADFYARFGFEPRGRSSYKIGTVDCDTIELVRPAETAHR